MKRQPALKMVFATLVGLFVASVSAPSMAEPPRSFALHQSMETLLQEARIKIRQGKYEEAASLMDAASVINSLMRDCDCNQAPPLRALSPSVLIERDLSTRL